MKLATLCHEESPDRGDSEHRIQRRNALTLSEGGSFVYRYVWPGAWRNCEVTLQNRRPRAHIYLVELHRFSPPMP